MAERAGIRFIRCHLIGGGPKNWSKAAKVFARQPDNTRRESVPADRKGKFRTEAFERHQRIEKALVRVLDRNVDPGLLLNGRAAT